MRRDKKRVKKTTGGAGGQPPAASDVEKRAVMETGLSAMPLEAEWFANIDNPRTRRAYRIDIHEFMAFVGIETPEAFRIVTRAHVLAWRKDLEGRELGGWNHPAQARSALLAL